MASGIYALSFNNYSSIYIGQSVDIDTRVSKHFSLLKHKKHYNHKLSELYSIYGNPSVDIVEICSISELTRKENEWIAEFDSYNNGINLRTLELTSSKGCDHPQSKFSREQIINTFELLLEPHNLIKDISTCTGVTEGMVSMIACGKSHAWLSEYSPEKYALLLSLVGSRRVYGQSARGKGKVYPTIIDTKGTEYSDISNIKEFAKEFKLDYCQLSKVLRGYKGAVSVKGWKLKQ